ncbi:MAG TPA: ABC transporter permease [Chromatiales bacterium]|nr:ABC transporter permease [Chromatiales bacterium]
MDWVLLPTDALFFCLLALAVVYAVRVARDPLQRAPWRAVFRQRTAAASAVVLAAFVLVALLDSLHFRGGAPGGSSGAAYSGQVVSVLDRVLDPLRNGTERTYSAPFATHAFVKEPVELPDGRVVRLYPRLRHGGHHLAGPGAGRGADIALRTVAGLALGLGAWLPLALGTLWWRARRAGRPIGEVISRVLRGRTVMPWRTVLVTWAVVFATVGVLGSLSLNYHVLGTDKVGEDVLYQTIKSIRTGLLIGTLTTLVMLPFALVLGLAAGYFRGWIDDLVQYLYTTLSSVPAVLLIAAAALMMDVYMANHPEAFASVVERADARLLFLCLILGVTSWTNLCRLLRAETLKLRELAYVEAAVALGVSAPRILRRHVLPNVMHIVVISVILDFSALVLAEAVLSYIQIGVDPTTYSWGNMINSARLELAREPPVWWTLLAAMLFMFALVLCANLFSDAVQTAFDPRRSGALR